MGGATPAGTAVRRRTADFIWPAIVLDRKRAKATGLKRAIVGIEVGLRAVIIMPHAGGGTSGVMDLTREQMTFLAELRKGACRATAAQDASAIGPLIRANLVQWDNDPDEAARRRKPPGSIFVLTVLGEACLAEHEAQERIGRAELIV